ncbi:MAG: hypothetical protein GY803_04920 [Chloroflexi bacterium]|nr:hypothetical protein [Chloroflexota bacterium]
MAGLKPRKRGRKANKEATEISQLQRENERLTRQLAQAELIIEAQKNYPRCWGLLWKRRETKTTEANCDQISQENKRTTDELIETIT